MCGISAYGGNKQAEPFIAEALKRLEYRGYDGYGLLLTDEENQWNLLKMTGPVNEYKLRNIPGYFGIGHTRWATHGQAVIKNTHPILDSKDGTVAVVHNGIVDNYEILKKSLQENNTYVFQTATDTEVISNLIHLAISRNPVETLTHYEFACYIFAIINQCLGKFAIAVMCKAFPGFVAVANHGLSMVVSPDGYMASDQRALAGFTSKFYRLSENEIAVANKECVQIHDIDTRSATMPIWKPLAETDSNTSNSEYDSFMEREILEQPKLLRKHVIFEGYFSKVPKRIVLVGCGSSYNAALLGKFYFESIAQIPTEVEYASELVYRPLLQPENTLFIGLTQSGETADTLLALEKIDKAGRSVVVVTNNNESKAATLYSHACMHVGPEIGVAATKTFTAECVLLLKLAVRFAEMQGVHFATINVNELCDEVLPLRMEDIMTPMQLEKLRSIAKILSCYNNALYLARYYNYPIALEGALKLKEVSYIHAEAMPAAEMKHGPIALVDENTISLFILTNQSEPRLQDKVLSNISEIQARDGKVIAIADTKSAVRIQHKLDYVCIPDVHMWIQPILANIPLQLLAYYTAKELGKNVDRPRGLAKSVTVE